MEANVARLDEVMGPRSLDHAEHSSTRAAALVDFDSGEG